MEESLALDRRRGRCAGGSLLSVYDERFFEELREGARRSAQVIVPRVIDLLHPQSVVDVGCGLGTWLAVFAEHGVADVVGVDGGYVDSARLEVPRERFVAHDLSTPLVLDRMFDLAVSLEVAEHLPPDRAATFVTGLTGLAPFVLFSAAIPFQGGTNHVNEQWPEYWAGLFEERGFAAADCLRREVWSDERVEWWYAQNLLLFVADERLARPLPDGRRIERTPRSQLALVHPRQYLYTVESPGIGAGPPILKHVSGDRLVSVCCENGAPDTMIVLAGTPLETSSAGATTLQAALPAGLRAGRYSLTLRDRRGESVTVELVVEPGPVSETE